MDVGHPICFLLLCDKLPHIHLLSYHFSESGLWTQLSWVLYLVSQASSHVEAQLGKNPLLSSLRLLAEFIVL